MFARCLTIGLLLGAVACGGGGGGGSDSSAPVTDGDDFSSGDSSVLGRVIDTYVNDVILATYLDLEQSAAVLQSAASTYASNPTPGNLDAAKAAWVRTRVPWEMSETHLFGPVDSRGFDPALDSWPTNQTDLEAVLASNALLTKQTVGALDNTLKGFHAIEFLLWGGDSFKTSDQFTAREGEYLRALTESLHDTTAALYAAWATGIDGQPPYALEVTNAGKGSSTFPSQRVAIQQMVEGMVVICREVSDGKIAEPFDQRNPHIVESQFSFNSIADFANNIRGGQNAFNLSVSQLVSIENPALDAKVRSQFATAIAAIQAIPEPFREAILDSKNDATIRAAQAAVRALADTLEGEVTQEVLS